MKMLFTSLSTASDVKNCHFRLDFTTNSDLSVKIGKAVTNKGNLMTFLQLSCSNFNLKLSGSFKSYKNCKWNKLWSSLMSARSKKLFPETIIHKIFETNSSFHVKHWNMRKLEFLFFSIFFASINTIFILTGRQGASL